MQILLGLEIKLQQQLLLTFILPWLQPRMGEKKIEFSGVNKTNKNLRKIDFECIIFKSVKRKF